MPATQVSLHTTLVPTDLGYGSGGWRVQEWYAAAVAPGRVIGWDPAASGWMGPGDPHHLQGNIPIWVSDNSFLHYLFDPANIAELASKYFHKNITTNPYWEGNSIVVMFTKNGGNPHVDVVFPLICEAQVSAEPSLVAASEPVRLTAEQLDLLGSVSDAAAKGAQAGDFDAFLKKILPTTPEQDKLFRDEAKNIFNRTVKK